MPKLYDALKASYESIEDAKKRLLKDDFILINELSNHNQKIFFNPKTKKLLMVGAGTHNLSDIGTDIYLAAGKLKNTKRYKEAKEVLEKARNLFPSAKGVEIVGHSLFGAIASGIGKKTDKITTYNKGVTIGQKTRPNEHAYRTEGDIVSILSDKPITLNKKTQNLRQHKSVQNVSVPTFFKSHNLENLKNSNINVGESFSTKTNPTLINHNELESSNLRGGFS
jgi:hypothetical protein